jgi:gamma-glutamylcyclotransferase (GGCT)/AIG2-like uncharacterized protein YtfP
MKVDNESLFIYGSLQPGAPNEHVLSAVEGCWEPAFVRGRLVDAGWGAELGYPGLIIDNEGQEVHGQLFTSSALGAKLAELDQLEGEEYTRTVLTAVLKMEPKSKRLPKCWQNKSNKRYTVLIRELMMAHLSSC